MKTIRLFVLTAAAVICLGAAQPTPAMQPAPVAATMAIVPTAAPMVAVPVMQPPVTAMTAAAPTAVPAPAVAMAATTVPQTPPVAAPTTVAPAPKKDSTGSVLGGILLQLLLGVLLVAVPIIATPLIKWVLKKMKITDLQTQQVIDDTVDKAVVFGLNYANEHAHKLRDNPVTGAEKLNIAADKALVYLKDSKIIDKGAEYIKDLIEAKLGGTRTDEVTKTVVLVEKPVEEDKKPVEEK